MTKDMMDVLFELLEDIKDDQKDQNRVLNEIRITQAKQAIILEEHQKASSTNGKRLTKLEDEIIPEICNKIAPKPVNWKKTISWALGSLLTLTSILAALYKLGLF